MPSSSSMDKNKDILQQKLKMYKSSSLEHRGRHGSLIEGAKIDKLVNEEMMRKMRRSREESLDEGVDGGGVVRYVVTFEVGKNAKLSAFLSRLEGSGTVIVSVNKRLSKSKPEREEVMVEFRGSLSSGDKVVELGNDEMMEVVVKKLKDPDEQEAVVVPRCLDDLDQCSHLVCKFDPSFDQQHPGFTDAVYRERREKIANMAFSYKSGSVIASVEYSEEEVKTWTVVYEKLKGLYKTHACRQHLQAMELLEKEGVYSSNHIPQLEDVSRFLRNKTGFRLKPVGGIVSARDFLASLAFRVFQSTQYVRHPSRPEYSIEPDCIHELLGHVPMLADPEFAHFSQQIGLASLGTTDQEIEKLSTLYWFTVEYGLCREGDGLKAYGAGILTSFGELQYALTDKPKKVPFDLDTVTVQSYDDQDFQEVYFVAESFEDMKTKVRDYTSKLSKATSYRCDPYTNTLHDLSQPANIRRLVRDISDDIQLLASALESLQ